MNLRTLAESDLAYLLEDSVNGFGWDITVTNPAGTSVALVGDAGDVGQMIDLDTGEIVSGRLAQVTLRLSSLATAGFGIPQGIEDPASKPWLMTFDDINGNAYTFKVVRSFPDRKLGVVKVLLGVYET